MSIIIRDAFDHDIAAIVELSIAGAIEPGRYPPLDLSDPGYMAAFNAIQDDPHHRLLVAVDGEEIVGTIQVSFVPGLPDGGAWRGMLESVHVRADRRGQGIGARLTEHGIALCREKGCKMVQLTSNKKRTDAHRFYERLGFTASHAGFKLNL